MLTRRVIRQMLRRFLGIACPAGPEAEDDWDRVREALGGGRVGRRAA